MNHVLPSVSDVLPMAEAFMREKASKDTIAFHRYCLRLEAGVEEESSALAARMKYYTADEATDSLFPTEWHATAFHRLYDKIICDAIKNRATDKKKFHLISVPPQLGKTTNLLRAVLFYVLKIKGLHTLYMSYNEPMAEEKGGDVRGWAEDTVPLTHPDIGLEPQQKSKGHLQFTNGNNMYFTSVTGTISGRAIKVVMIDDPAKWDTDSGSEANLEKIYNDLVAGALSRMHADTVFFMIHTRKFIDDPIGRFTSTENPLHEFVEYHNFMDIIETEEDAANDPLGRPIGGLLHEEKHNLMVIHAQKAADSDSFYAMYQGKPTNPEGNEIPVDEIKYYDELPVGLTNYMSSDHAASIKKAADFSVIGLAGVDPRLNIYIHPDLIWERLTVPDQVTRIINYYIKHNAEDWTMEKGVIWSALKPAIFAQLELDEKDPMMYRPIATNAGQTAQGKLWGTAALRTWIQKGKVWFPSQKVFDDHNIGVNWTEKAIKELRNFDGTRSTRTKKDDFVDFLKLVGLRINRLSGSIYIPPEPDKMDRMTRQILNSLDKKK